MAVCKRLIRTAVFAAALVLPVNGQALDRVTLKVSARGDAAVEETVRKVSVLAGMEDQPATAASDVVAAARGDYVRLVEALYALGYYSVTVSILIDGREAALIDPFHEPAQVGSAEIRVDPGRKFRFGAVRIGPLAPGTVPAEAFRRGQPAYATVVRDAAQGAVTGWREAGYAKADIAGQSVQARHGAAELDVDVDVAPGRQVRFGDVIVSGESKVRPSRVRQIAGLPTGEVYSPKAVDKAAARLRKTGTFKSVTVSEADTVSADGTMDMEIAVVDRKPRRIGGGVEFSSFDGLTLSGYWLHRNLLGRAERFRLDGEVAQLGGAGKGVDYSLSFRAEKPAVYGPDTLVFAEGGLFYTDEPSYLERKAELTLGASREINERLTGDIGIGYSFSRITDRYAVPNTTRELRLISLPLALTFDNRDDPLDATSGFYLRGEVTPFHETRRSQSGAHLTFDGRAYRTVGAEGGTVLAGRLQLGAMMGPRAQDAPPDFLFFSGGGGTVRGQPYASLGADYGGVTLGGRSFAAVSTEVRVPINDKFGVVAFADAGFVGTGGFDDGDWHAGAGLGVRYKTPVGPIRVDVGGPVAGSTGSGVHLYVGIGQAF